MFACLLAMACSPRPETVYTLTPPTWFEDGWSFYDVSTDGAWATYGARFGARLIDLHTSREDTARFRSPGARRAAGGPAAPISLGAEPHPPPPRPRAPRPAPPPGRAPGGWRTGSADCLGR